MAILVVLFVGCSGGNRDAHIDCRTVAPLVWAHMVTKQSPVATGGLQCNGTVWLVTERSAAEVAEVDFSRCAQGECGWAKVGSEDGDIELCIGHVPAGGRGFSGLSCVMAEVQGKGATARLLVRGPGPRYSVVLSGKLQPEVNEKSRTGP
jgi:hypothetical protein